MRDQLNSANKLNHENIRFSNDKGLTLIPVNILIENGHFWLWSFLVQTYDTVVRIVKAM